MVFHTLFWNDLILYFVWNALVLIFFCLKAAGNSKTNEDN